MKKAILFILSSVFLSGCTAVLKNSGYSSRDLVEYKKCEKFSYNLDSVVFWKRFYMMGPFIPLFPSWSESESYGLNLKAEKGVELDHTYCPTIRIDGNTQPFDSFNIERNICSYTLLESELGEKINLEIEHVDCAPFEIELDKYKKWDYAPPFMVTV